MNSFNLKHIAHLARLEFRDEELKLFESQVAGILNFIEELKEVDVSSVEPTSHPLMISNVFRADVPKPSIAIENFLKHSPRSRGKYFEVPKVIEDK